MLKIIFFSRKNCFPEKKVKKKYVCLLYLKFSDPLSETHLFLDQRRCKLAWMPIEDSDQSSQSDQSSVGSQVSDVF